MTLKSKTRRDFLKASLLSGGGLCALGAMNPFVRLARAEESETTESADESGMIKDRYYIFCYFGGGWDILLSLDPRDPATFTAEEMASTRIQTGYELLDLGMENPVLQTPTGLYGYYLGDLATQHRDKISIVRGINMETLSHEGGRLRFMTGRMPEGAVPTRDSTDVVMAALLGEANLVPNIALSADSFNNGHPSYATALTAESTAAVVEAMSRKNTLDPALEGQIDLLLNQHNGCPHALASSFLARAHGSRVTTQQMLSSNLGDTFDFTLETNAVKAVRSHYGFSKTDLAGVPALTALAEQALVQKVSRCISIRVPGHFDTHTTLEQGADQMAAFNAIARLIDNLEQTPYPDNSGDSWLDRTTVMCFSEFSRTPIVNSEVGRDHWLTNACLLAGGGIKGGQVVGASSDIGMTPRPLNLTTGLVDEGSKPVTPDHIVRGLYTMLGYTEDVADLRVEPLTAMLK